MRSSTRWRWEAPGAGASGRQGGEEVVMGRQALRQTFPMAAAVLLLLLVGWGNRMAIAVAAVLLLLGGVTLYWDRIGPRLVLAFLALLAAASAIGFWFWA